MTATPTHLLPENCHICGRPESEHPEVIAPEYLPSGYLGHTFWPNAEAMAEAHATDARTHARSAEATYVAEYRPY